MILAALLAISISTPTPHMIGRGVISTKYETVGAAQAADGIMVYVRSCPGTLLTKTILCQSTLKNGKWQSPNVLPFSGTDFDFDPQFTPDGKQLLFVSNRDHKHHFTIWSVDRTGGKWGQPHKLPSPINEKGHQLSASEAKSGAMYVCSTRAGQGALYCVKDSKVVPIDVINKVGYINDACIAPDESYIVFAAIGGKDEMLTPGAIYQRGDLYISLRKDGVWQTPFHLPAPLNTTAGETTPTLSPDGMLYFASDRGFMTKARSHPVTYQEITKEIHGDENCLSKIWGVKISDVLALLASRQRLSR